MIIRDATHKGHRQIAGVELARRQALEVQTGLELARGTDWTT
jgi:hypothetical protein